MVDLAGRGQFPTSYRVIPHARRAVNPQATYSPLFEAGKAGDDSPPYPGIDFNPEKAKLVPAHAQQRTGFAILPLIRCSMTIVIGRSIAI